MRLRFCGMFQFLKAADVLPFYTQGFRRLIERNRYLAGLEVDVSFATES